MCQYAEIVTDNNSAKNSAKNSAFVRDASGTLRERLSDPYCWIQWAINWFTVNTTKANFCQQKSHEIWQILSVLIGKYRFSDRKCGEPEKFLCYLVTVLYFLGIR
ncbi:hypothetical protein AM228_24205 [Planktothricoides sp. SR001]|nr:hypothetical protein AM228_24205 [Planktothricoides sp. SR001]